MSSGQNREGPGTRQVILPLGADGDDFLLIFGRLGEHAQFQHRPPRTRKIQHHIGVVEDVRRPAVIDLVTVIVVHAAGGKQADRIRLHDQAHQIEKMTAFFDQRAAGIFRETIPVSDLRQKRIAMLAHGQHHGRGGCPLPVDLVDHFRDRRHVAIFHADPDRHAGPCRQRLQRPRLCNRDAHRLLDQDRHRSLRNDHRDLRRMTMVRAGDQDGVEAGRCEDILDPCHHPRLRCETFGDVLHPGIGFENRGDFDAR